MGLAGRTLRPLHIIGPSTIGGTAQLMDVRGRDQDNNIVAGQCEELTLVCTHATLILSVSFNGTDWVRIGTNGASKTFTVSCKRFWLIADGSGATYQAFAGIL